MPKVLVIATSHKTRGGITSVVKAHQQGEQWKEFHCKWIETHIDKGAISKLFFLIKGWMQFMFNLPSCQIVHIHMSEPASAIRKCFFLPFAKLFGKKVIMHFHAFSPDTTIRGKHGRVYKYLFNNADRVIVLSQLWKTYVNDEFHLGDKVVVVYNPCTTEILKGSYPKRKQILYAGTVNARKGYADMIRAFARIANKYQEWSIVFAGNGEVKQGEELAKSLRIDKQTAFLGWISGAEKDRAFKEASIFCLPSYAEGFPMAVLDAWAYGLPVITTPVGGICDVAIDGENMLLFSPGDVEKLSFQLERMITNHTLREHISMASHNFATSKFNIDTINRQLGDLYAELSAK